LPDWPFKCFRPNFESPKNLARRPISSFVLGGVVGLALTAIGVKGWFPFAALMAGALVPVVYSLVFYKQLERREL
jgi:hypothetical protein